MSELIATFDDRLVDASGRPIEVPKVEEVSPEDIPMEKRGLQLPEPKGYRILCAVPEAEDEFDLGNGVKLAKDSGTKRLEENGTVVLFVLKLGDMAYKDESRFPTGPWCKEGDFILTRAYAGTRFKIHGREFRVIADDTVEGVVQDPRGYSRA